MPSAIRDTTPAWLKAENASVFDSYWKQIARRLGHVIGADDPAAQVMGVLTADVPAAGTELTTAAQAIKDAAGRGLTSLKAFVTGDRAAALDLSQAARLQRAAEQGFTTDVLHGRAGDYEAVAIPSWKRSSDAGALGEGFYATPATEKGAGVADWYASQAGPRENVMPLKLKLENPLIIQGTPGSDPRPMAVARLSKEWGLHEHPRFSGSKQLNPDWAAEFSDALRARGYDGVVADLGSVKEYMVLSPQQVRSRFAAFDPRQLANPNLLAGVGGGILLSQLGQPSPPERR